MRENVVDELQQAQPDDKTKQKMLDILKRFHSEEKMDSMDEDDSTLSEEIIQKVLSGGEVSFDDLSAEERKSFQRALASGELSRMIEPWEPWWLKPSAGVIVLSKEGTQLVQSLAEQETPVPPKDDQESNLSSGIPPGPKTPLPPVSKLCTAKPSPFLAFHLVDIIYSYCFTLRLYNGDWQSDPTGSAMVVLSVSSVLVQGAQPESVLEALSYCLEQTCSPAYRHIGGVQLGLLLFDDVVNLVYLGGSALICLLCDLERLVQAAAGELKSEKPRRSRGTEMKSKLKLAERKIYFTMCWVHEQPAGTWSTLAAVVEAEKSLVMNYGVGKGFKEIGDGAKNKGKVLIEEME